MKKGFSIIELVVSMSIFALLLAIVLIDFKSAQGKFALERTAYSLSKVARYAQELGMASQEVAGYIPSGGFGIYFSKTGTFNGVFADNDGDGSLSSGEMYYEFKFEKNIILKDLRYVSGYSESASVVFIPPDPQVSFYVKYGETEIKLNPSIPEMIISICQTQDGINCLADPAKTKEIVINRAGLVSICQKWENSTCL